MDYENEQAPYEDDARGYRDRSRSPRAEGGDDRARSRSPGGDDRHNRLAPPSAPLNPEEEEEARNPGTNLFVTGIHPRLTEEDINALFAKYGHVEKANIMRDPHTKESRGFGFVNMATGDEADAAKEALQGENIEGRTLSIEKARRAKPRTPTPGKYFGPPKSMDPPTHHYRPQQGQWTNPNVFSEDDGRGPPRRGGYGDRYGGRRGDDRGYGGGRYGGSSGGRDRYDDRYDDRGYGGGYGGGRRDRYDDRGYDDRRYGGGGRRGGGGSGGPGGDYYDRDYRRGPPAYGDAPPARRSYDRPPPPGPPADDGYAGR